MTSNTNDIPSQINALNSILMIYIGILLCVMSSSVFANSMPSNDAAHSNHNKQVSSQSLINNELGLSLYSNAVSYGQIEFNLSSYIVKSLRNSNKPRHTAIHHANTFLIENWDHQYLPLLDGLPINVKGKSLTISINQGDTEFFIATDKEQALFSSNGQVIWKHETKETAIEAIIHQNKQTIIVRYDNDIIRWYDYKKGKILFSLYVSPESLQWVIWASSGYYDSSDPDFSLSILESNSINIHQLRDYLFRPGLIKTIINNKDSSAIPAIELPKQLTPIKISILDTDEQQIQFCISSSSNKPKSVLFTVDGVTVQRKIISHLDDSQHCKQVAIFSKIQSDTDYLLSVRAFDLDSRVWSDKFNHTVSSTSSVPRDNKATQQTLSKVIYIVNKSKQSISTKNKQLFSTYFDNTSIRHLDLSSYNKKPNIAKPDGPFILYLSSDCSLSSNDILFSSKNQHTQTMRLSRLKNNLQITNERHSLVFIDCFISDKEFNRFKAKQFTHNFMFETGRNVLVQFSIKEEKHLPKKESFMMRTLEKALNGGADEDDSLSINSKEFMNFMIRTLPEITFEGTGDSGITFNQIKDTNVFRLPISLE